MQNYDIEQVMKYFYEISKIPRMSGKEKKIADYIEEFAKKRNLEYSRDTYNNIIIKKEASKWSKSTETIILQSHLDMVCEKEEHSNHDFEKEGLDLYIEDDFIKARETTLGADNGIGVAMILAILDSNEIIHPRIEIIFTVQEESTMEGAKKINLNSLKGYKMISLDNMNEEELWIGCASAKIFDCKLDIKKKNVDDKYKLIKIGINGFAGGHSGKDIAKGRGNPIEEMGILLKKINDKYEICLKNIYGGRKVNVIPRECYSEIYVKSDDVNGIYQEIKNYKKQMTNKNNEKIDIFIIEKEDITEKSQRLCTDTNTTNSIIDIINCIPNGVYYNDKYENPLVSLNIGKICIDNNELQLSFSIRSNRKEIEKKLIDRIYIMMKRYNIELKTSKLSGYEHKERSDFIEKCKKIYCECLNRNPKLIDMHICLEAGFFGEKMPELDFIAIAPNIYDAHSPKERCSISSLHRIYNYVLKILEQL